ncbi:hypothetical protein [Pectobacterium wasabiae]|uniref:NfeD-like C-terminal domain-containing protein n=1 Tax=Pectobacterium wasabiae TaxID=55208 RepID=A0AAW3EKE7_9GAMM|nr:hypothetical protein [Pectobacterium wasabiae]KFX09255.1 hypothetical protein JV38_06055 [Pectobacterium wasabiae]KGA29362.1 hypothetical protein KU73_09775 [Pectobacterium wasabiae]
MISIFLESGWFGFFLLVIGGGVALAAIFKSDYFLLINAVSVVLILIMLISKFYPSILLNWP